MDYLIAFLVFGSVILNFYIISKISSSNRDKDNYDFDKFVNDVNTNLTNLQSVILKTLAEQYNTNNLRSKEINELMINRINENNKNMIDILSTNYDHYNRMLNNAFSSMSNNNNSAFKNQRETIDKNFSTIASALFSQLKTERDFNSKILSDNSTTLTNGLTSLTNTTDTKLNLLINNINESFIEMRKDMNQQIDNIRQTVNEKLDKTLNEQFDKSFRNVLTQMNDLQKSMGELKVISTQVGSLEKTLNGVKTRGIMGEVQLKSIISDALTPSQYDVEVSTKPGSNDHVEIAIKLPEKDGNGYIYLPIDSKCHLDRYEELLDSYDSGNPEYIKAAKKRFAEAIRKDAQTIYDKYISIPETTPYAILFVPFEGMYSEIVNLNLLDELNRNHITVAGPYTLLAILSTITNYFQALAIEKKSRDIERTLGKVKTEFNKYNDTLSKVRKNLDLATKSLEHLQMTRTRAIGRALDGITEITDEVPLIDDESIPLLPEDYE